MKATKTRLFPFRSRALALVPASLLALGVPAGCSKEEAAPREEAAVIETVPSALPEPFTPPENGLLTEGQVRRFLEAHKALQQVNELYLDSLEGATPERQRSVNQALDIARDKATRKFGLNGYEEYRWILEDAPRRPENVRILESRQVKTVTGRGK
jgi:hypothetical protein